MSATTETYKPFTEVTWSDHAQSGLSAGMVPNWMAQCDLAYELVERFPNLSIESARVLVDGVCAGLPIILTWVPEAWRKKVRSTVIVRQLHGYYETSSAQVKRWGFDSPVPVSRIVDAEAPGTEYDV